MGIGRIILLVTIGFTMLIFFIDLAIIIYEQDQNLREYKRYERRELKKFVKEWHEENKRIEGKGKTRK